MITHRLARTSDLEAVYAIYMHPAVISYLGFDAMPLSEFVDVFNHLLQANDFFVVERNGLVRGFYRATRQEGRSRHVATFTTLAISPDDKGSGLAYEMISTSIERLRQEGVLRVELMVESDNARAFAFYRKLGFVQEGLLPAAYKRRGESEYIDELYLGKLLAPVPRKTNVAGS